MIGAVDVVDELIRWAIPAACVGIVGIVRLSYRAIRHLEEVGRRVEELHDYTRYHLGPNGESPSIHARLGALEKFHGLDPGD